MRINTSRKITALIFVGIFLLILLCNALTELVADDFAYMFSWENGERITNIWQIFPSMRAHSHIMNGRFIAHFFVQLFLMLPKFVFNIVNSLVFTLTMFFIYRLAKPENENNFLALGVFACVWIFTPAFGQVFLWLDGACNYLWAVFLNLLFLIPFVKLFSNGIEFHSKATALLHLLISFVAGAMSENISSAFIFMAVLLLVATKLVQHRRVPVPYLLCTLAAFIGYLTIVFAPAESAKKAELTFFFFRYNFMLTLEQLQALLPLLIAFVVLFSLSCTQKVKRERIILAVVFALGALFAHFIMVAARYYPERSILGSLIMLVIADGILAEELFNGKKYELIVCVHSVLLLFLLLRIPVALNDIYETNAAIANNEAYIYECKANGEMDIEIYNVQPKTKYSALYGLSYLDLQDVSSGLHKEVLKYYGVNSISEKELPKTEY